MELLRRYLPAIANEDVPPHMIFAPLVVLGGLYAYFRQGHSLWITLATLSFFLAIWGVVNASRAFWEIREDCVVQRQWFRRTVFPFSQIAYVGPMTGQASQYEHFAKHILIRNAAGEKMIVITAQYEAFLKEMRKHLPLVTLNL